MWQKPEEIDDLLIPALRLGLEKYIE